MLESEIVLKEDFENQLFKNNKIEFMQYNLTKMLKEIVINHGSTGVH